MIIPQNQSRYCEITPNLVNPDMLHSTLNGVGGSGGGFICIKNSIHKTSCVIGNKI